jgi:hypothetical protein
MAMAMAIQFTSALFFRAHVEAMGPTEPFFLYYCYHEIS